jgi:Acetyltransferase (GNAT) domain
MSGPANFRSLSARSALRSSAQQGSPSETPRHALRVDRHDGIIALEALAQELDAVNDSSARPSPFGTSAFTIAYASSSERDPLGMDVRLFVVRDSLGLALGWAVFAFRIDELVALPTSVSQRSPAVGQVAHQVAKLGRASRLELMTTSDVDRPGIVARLGCEDVVAKALLTHLVGHELDWTLLEWRAQERDAPLWRAAHAMANPFLSVRDVELDPYSEVALQWPNLEKYFGALSKRMRSNVSRQARKLFASGDVGLVLVDGSQATEAFFDAYTDLETRSWKHQSSAAMNRHPLRRKFYSRIVSGQAGIEPSMIGITLDGVLIAALINGRFGDRMWSMEMAFDESLNELGPGQLLLLLAVMDGLTKHCRSLNFFQLHGYFKKRWLADELPVVNVKLIRRPSLHDARSLSGDVLRWTKTKAAQRSKRTTGASMASNEEQTRIDDGQSAGQSSPKGGGFNAVKRAASSAKSPVLGELGEEVETSKMLDPVEETIRQRAVFQLAVERARGHDRSNCAKVRIFDKRAAAAMLPFSIR